MNTPTGPDACHCLAARRAARRLTRLYDARLAAAQINISQFAILGFVQHQPGIGMDELASRMGMDRTTLLRALKPLLRDDLLAYDAATPRRKAIALTQSGEARLAEAEPLWRSAQQELEDEFGARRAHDLRAELLAVGQPA